MNGKSESEAPAYKEIFLCMLVLFLIYATFIR